MTDQSLRSQLTQTFECIIDSTQDAQEDSPTCEEHLHALRMLRLLKGKEDQHGS